MLIYISASHNEHYQIETLMLQSGEGSKLEVYHPKNDSQPLFTWTLQTTHSPPLLAQASPLHQSLSSKHTALETFMIGYPSCRMVEKLKRKYLSVRHNKRLAFEKNGKAIF